MEIIINPVRLLNLAGLPPFSGFFAKLFLIKTIINFTPLFLIFMLNKLFVSVWGIRNFDFGTAK